jgi:hypothetical protein
MAKRTANEGKKSEAPAAGREIPITVHSGVNAAGTKTVLVSALLEVTGQVRFGDGTDISTTITEKDIVLTPNGRGIEKAIWAGTKRRGVDRRTIHEMRDQSGWNRKCFIPELCGMCPTCWLFGFTGTTQEKGSEVKGINAKSRVLYATAVSIEDTSRCLNRHSRNQVNEKSQTTASSAGIHEEEVIVAGTHFPTYTSLLHVLDWEVGVVAHALLENLNSNRYTAASRGQGGIRFAERDGEPAIIVDESSCGVFPLPAPKVASWEADFEKALPLFAPTRKSAVSLLPLQELLQRQGFAVEAGDNKLTARAANVEIAIESNDGYLLVHQGNDELMRRYYGNQALGYLRQKQIAAYKKLAELTSDEFRIEAVAYAKAIRKESADDQPAPAAPPASEPGPGENPPAADGQ